MIQKRLLLFFILIVTTNFSSQASIFNSLSCRITKTLDELKTSLARGVEESMGLKVYRISISGNSKKFDSVRRLSSGKFQTTPMLSTYVGESVSPPIGLKPVKYFDDLSPFEMKVNENGELIQPYRGNRLIDVNQMNADFGHKGQRVVIFIMTEDGDIYFSPRHQSSPVPVSG
jgi:hypothetical protein